MQTEKIRFPNAVGLQVAAELCAAFKPVTRYLVVAGSLRRRKADVGDVEILYIPRTERRADPDNMFGEVDVNLMDEVILGLEQRGVLERRKNVNGSTMFGPKNKLMRHRATGMPVDLFAATDLNRFNYLVCRTGPAELNERIARAAREIGWKWNPYGEGFTGLADGRVEAMTSEEAVFRFVNLPYLPPEQRR